MLAVLQEGSARGQDDAARTRGDARHGHGRRHAPLEGVLGLGGRREDRRGRGRGRRARRGQGGRSSCAHGGQYASGMGLGRDDPMESVRALLVWGVVAALRDVVARALVGARRRLGPLLLHQLLDDGLHGLGGLQGNQELEKIIIIRSMQ